MARLPRLKLEDSPAWYHLCARVAGWLDWFPFQDPLARQKLFSLMRLYLDVYFCQTASFCLMDNHYHLVLRFEPFRSLSRQELYERACRLYPRPEQVLRSPRQWERFNQRLFNVSELMRNLQMSFAKWYNRHYQRRGSFWAERFKSVLLQEEHSLLDTILYVELNPVRAGLVQRPEQWPHSSAHLRLLTQDQWLLPLEHLLPKPHQHHPLPTFRSLLYYRGAIPGKSGSPAIPHSIVREEQARGFLGRGLFRKRIRCFSDGLILGTHLQIQKWIDRLRRQGRYLRRRHPVKLPFAATNLFMLREQRSLPSSR